MAELFATLFARDGWIVTTCLNGQRAADALGGSASYDAVVVSNRLHGMNGVALITRIRALDHRRDVPIVMVTGTVECAVLADALAAGADDVLYKPVDVVISRRHGEQVRRTGPAAAIETKVHFAREHGPF